MRDALATEAGLIPDDLQLDEADVDTLLEAARLAAHESGDRRNAPLLCFLLGRASKEVELNRLVARIRSS
jgi:hypothetical protein